jgi:hypothetical protein
MWAAFEYLLYGLPVVSTRSIGGRDRYFLGAYCRIVDDDPYAVAAAVHTHGARKFDRLRIRSHVAEILAFDRYNFLLNANKVAKKQLGSDPMLSTFEPLIGAYSNYISLRDVVAKTRFRMGGEREGAQVSAVLAMADHSMRSDAKQPDVVGWCAGWFSRP